jgi:hypothetical protein
MSRRQDSKEFEEAGYDHVKALVNRGIYSGEKLKNGRRWIWRHDHYYARVAMWVSIAALLLSCATCVSNYLLPDRSSVVSARPTIPAKENLQKSDTSSTTQPSK